MNKTQLAAKRSPTPINKQQFSITIPLTTSKHSASNQATSNAYLLSRQTDLCQIYHNPLIFIIPSKGNKQIQLLLLMINSHPLSQIIAIPLRLASVKKSVLG